MSLIFEENWTGKVNLRGLRVEVKWVIVKTRTLTLGRSYKVIGKDWIDEGKRSYWEVKIHFEIELIYWRSQVTYHWFIDL